MQGHIIVCGDDPLGMRIIEQLRAAGREIAIVDSSEGLPDAGIADAAALICADDDDALNLEIALLARQLNPEVRVVARLGNSVLREAVAIGNGPGAILDVADLAAPSVVEACLSRTTHSITVAGIEFVISGTDAPRDATLRELFGDLAPVAVMRGENSATPGEVVRMPRPRRPVSAGDWTAMIGTAEELAAQGIAVAAPARRREAERTSTRNRCKRVLDAMRAFRDDVNPNFFKAFAASMTLLLSATLLLRFAYHKPGMSFIDALYFSTETIATVGYGDFSFVDQPTWLRLFGIGLMFAGVTSTAVLMAFVADLLLSRRIAQNAGLRKVRELHDHIIVVGLGSFGIRVVADLKAAGHDVAVIERSPDNRYLSSAAELDVPVIFGDATLAADARVGPHRRRRGGRGADPGRHGQHRDGHRAARTARGPLDAVGRQAGRARRAARLRPHARGGGGASLRVRERAVDRGARRAVVHRHGDGPAGARHVLGGPAVVHGRRRRGRAGQRTRRAADGADVDADPGHRHRPRAG